MLYLERHRSRIDKSHVALGAGHSRIRSGAQDVRAVLGADDRRHAELAAHDCGVARAAAAIGHDGLGLLHDRLPIRVGLIGDKNLALAKFVERFHALNHSDWACGDLFANTAPCDQDLPAGFEMVDLDGVRVLARLHRLGPRLEDK